MTFCEVLKRSSASGNASLPEGLACRICVSGEVWSMNINDLSTLYAQTRLIVGKEVNVCWYAWEVISVICVRRKLLKVQLLWGLLSAGFVRSHHLIWKIHFNQPNCLGPSRNHSVVFFANLQAKVHDCVSALRLSGPAVLLSLHASVAEV